jgi:hypothetical protein
MGPTKLCVGPALCILNFVEDIFDLEFEEDPCYQKLKHHLCKVLLTYNLIPDNIFDWTKGYTKRGPESIKKKILLNKSGSF